MVEPLPKGIYEKAKQLGVDEIHLEFSGGSDEGYLHVNIIPFPPSAHKAQRDKHSKFEDEIEEWAWEAYNYSGAGDGSSYGDSIKYDIVSKTVSHTEWWHAYQEAKMVDGEPLEIKRGEEE